MNRRLDAQPCTQQSERCCSLCCVESWWTWDEYRLVYRCHRCHDGRVANWNWNYFIVGRNLEVFDRVFNTYHFWVLITEHCVLFYMGVSHPFGDPVMPQYFSSRRQRRLWAWLVKSWNWTEAEVGKWEAELYIPPSPSGQPFRRRRCFCRLLKATPTHGLFLPLPLGGKAEAGEERRGQSGVDRLAFWEHFPADRSHQAPDPPKKGKKSSRDEKWVGKWEQMWGTGTRKTRSERKWPEGQDVKLRWARAAFDSFVCKRDEVF